ncbi:MAG: ParB N-terminal domain-containing protein [Pseudomonadota bacterium]
MAKRKRLSPAGPSISILDPAPFASEPMAPRRPPIADVAGDAAAQAALQEVSSELAAARSEGRMVLSLPLSAVRADHLERDRVVLDPEEMAVLKDSLRDRGQQTPIEVVDLGEGVFGLISGWRRLAALQVLCKETDDAAQFGRVNVLVRAPDTATEAYRAMVEENEIRADLSFYERAHIALKTVEQGIYPDLQTAVQDLFAAARAPKRSKIVAFAKIVEHLGDVLRFPAEVPEKVGLALVAVLRDDSEFRNRLIAALADSPPGTAVQERTIIDATLRGASKARMPRHEDRIAPGLSLTSRGRQITLKGTDVDEALLAALRGWLAKRY